MLLGGFVAPAGRAPGR